MPGHTPHQGSSRDQAGQAPIAEIALEAGAELGEGPIWDARSDRLVWVDILGRAVHVFDPVTGVDRAIAVPGMPGIAVPRRAGGLVLAIDHGFGFVDDAGRFELIAEVPQGSVTARMNDGNCDAAGRLWAGTTGLNAEPGAGVLYRLDPDLRVTAMLEGVTESNGIDWSPDDRRMYYVDTMERRVDVFDFDLESGAITNRRPFAAVDDGEVLPDGLTVDADGHVWVACWGGAAVRRFTPDGVPAGGVSLPTPHITSPGFGGRGLDRLFITSAREGLSDDQRAADAAAGDLFVCEPAVTGRAPRLFEG